jgi:hypothetical protein
MTLKICLPKDYHKTANPTLTQGSNLALLLPIGYLSSIQPYGNSKFTTKLLYIHLCFMFIASCVYHGNPSDTTIVPDMLGVSSVTLLFSFILLQIQKKHLPWLYVMSGTSVAYFAKTKNMIPYVGVLGIPPLYVAYSLWNRGYNREISEILGLLVLMRVLEHRDASVYRLTGLNGHAGKHLFAGLVFVRLIQLCQRLEVL